MDDLGYGDIGVNGALQYETPNIDQMAHEGIRFTNFLTAQAVCSASRSALLTGCYPNRIGFSGALMPTAKVGINSSETTLAEMLKQKGYATAIAGKWHLHICLINTRICLNFPANLPLPEDDAKSTLFSC